MRTLFTFCFVFLFAQAAWTQRKIVLAGTVTDEFGEALPGATVRIFHQEKLTGGSITDLEGRFQVSLGAGQYRLEASCMGFAPQTLVKTLQSGMPAENANLHILLWSGLVLPEVLVEARFADLISCTTDCFFICHTEGLPNLAVPKQSRYFSYEPEFAPAIRIYPNPAVTVFTLDLPVEVESVFIFDAAGKMVRQMVKPVAGANIINVQDLPAGNYSIQIFNDNGVESEKLIVVRE